MCYYSNKIICILCMRKFLLKEIVICPRLLDPRIFNQSQNLVFFFFFIFYFFIDFWLLGLRCCTWAFSTCGKWGLLFIAVYGLLIVVASLVAEHGLQARRLRQLQHAGSVVVAHGLWSTGSVFVAHGLSCSMACGIFPDQGSNLCPLHWQADS